MGLPTTSPLLSLPAELIQQILSVLSPIDLADVSGVCRALHNHARDDTLWQRFVQENVHGKEIRKPGPGLTFQQMYLQHSPYWFLAKHKVWFSDSPHHGKVIICRYSAARRCIEGYALAAERGHLDLEFWDHNPDVIIHMFSPRVQLHLDQPIIRIYAASARNFPADDHRFQREISMNTFTGPARAATLHSKFILSRPLPPSAIGPQTQIWPPMKFPAVERTRNQSADGFRTNGHRPSRLSEISEHTFRVKRWMEFSSAGAGISMRMGEDVNTYATLPPDAYTPTPDKPWRGIWVGDYAGHGCEFLAILQPDEPVQLPERAQEFIRRAYRRMSAESSSSWQTALSNLPTEEPEEDDDEEEEEEATAQTNWVAPAASTEWMGLLPQEHRNTLLGPIEEHADQYRAKHSNRVLDEPREVSGQLLAVKLTGDLNVPRGEYTFIAPDLGPEGTVRIAQEQIFRGARVVRSCGHVASAGFTDDAYIPSQLILISSDKIAQYWEAFGHISFYQRVDIDGFTECD